MGNRVAVMRDGVLQQVDAPERHLRRADEPLRRELRRLAGDEPARGEVERDGDGVVLPAADEVGVPGARVARGRRALRRAQSPSASGRRTSATPSGWDGVRLQRPSSCSSSRSARSRLAHVEIPPHRSGAQTSSTPPPSPRGLRSASRARAARRRCSAASTGSLHLAPDEADRAGDRPARLLILRPRDGGGGAGRRRSGRGDGGGLGRGPGSDVEAALVDGELCRATSRCGRAHRRGRARTGAPGRGVAAPGFVDLQVNGFAGVDFFSADTEGYRRAAKALLGRGVTAFQPTFISSPEGELTAALRGGAAERRRAARARRAPRGPVPRPGAAGHASGGSAPRSRPGAARAAPCGRPGEPRDARARAARRARARRPPSRRGVTVSGGHSNATADEARDAFAHGALDRDAHLQRDAAVRRAGAGPGRRRARERATCRPGDRRRRASRGRDGESRVAGGRRSRRARHGCGRGGRSRATAPTARRRRRRGRERRGAAGRQHACREHRRDDRGGAEPRRARGAAGRRLAAASEVPARIAGRPELGTLAPGACADVVVLDDRSTSSACSFRQGRARLTEARWQSSS